MAAARRPHRFRPSGPGVGLRAGWRGSTVVGTAVLGSVLMAACTGPATPAGSTPSSSSAAVTSTGSPTAPAQPRGAKLIEIGWDTPGATYVRDHIRELEALPLDGIALTPRQGVTPELFEDRAWKADDVQIGAFASIAWKKFTDNYLSVRAHTSRGAWFDDARWDRIDANTRQLSAAVAAARARGIILDPEFYGQDEMADSAWRYNTTQYPDRDFAAVEAQVRRRGAQFMTALQSGKPDVTIVLMFSLGGVYTQAAEENGDRGSVQYALMPAFVNGMLDTAEPGVRIVDGNEWGYYYRAPQEYTAAAYVTRTKGATLLDPEHRARYERTAVGVAVSPDCTFGLWTGTEFFDEHCNPGKQSPAQLRTLLKDKLHAALSSADDVVWVYSESFDLVGPNLTGHPVEKPPAGLDRQAVLDAITAAREQTPRHTP